MVRVYKPKNAIFKGSRLSTEQTFDIICLYHSLEITPTEMAARLGVDRSAVHRVIKKYRDLLHSDLDLFRRLLFGDEHADVLEEIDPEADLGIPENLVEIMMREEEDKLAKVYFELVQIAETRNGRRLLEDCIFRCQYNFSTKSRSSFQRLQYNFYSAIEKMHWKKFGFPPRTQILQVNGTTLWRPRFCDTCPVGAHKLSGYHSREEACFHYAALAANHRRPSREKLKHIASIFIFGRALYDSRTPIELPKTRVRRDIIFDMEQTQEKAMRTIEERLARALSIS
ncbi:MAG: hypothetical protein AAFV45_12730 [Pseudomonadota bacterium]